MRIAILADFPNWVLGHHARTFAAWLTAQGHDASAWYYDQVPKLLTFDVREPFDVFICLDLGLTRRLYRVFAAGDRDLCGRDRSMIASEYWIKTWDLAEVQQDFIAETVVRDHYAVISKPVDAEVRKYLPAGVTTKVVRQFVDPARFYWSPERTEGDRHPGKIVIGWAGNGKSAAKNTPMLGAVMNEVARRGLPYEFHLAGKDLPLDLFLDRPNVKVLGMLDADGMRDFYSNLTLYLCVSTTESGPAPLLESLACGTPVVSTPVGMAWHLDQEMQATAKAARRSKHVRAAYFGEVLDTVYPDSDQVLAAIDRVVHRPHHPTPLGPHWMPDKVCAEWWEALTAYRGAVGSLDDLLEGLDA